MRRTPGYFNWKLAVVLILAVGVVAGTAFGLRQYQKTGRAQAALKKGNEAYEKGNWDEAATNLGRYLGSHQEEVPVLMKYAEAQTKRRPQKPGNFQQAIATYRNVLRLDKGNNEAIQRLSELYLAGNSPGEAEFILRPYIQENPGAHPEIRRLLGAALASLGQYEQAQKEWEAVIDANSEYVPAYEFMGRMAEQHPATVSEPAGHWFDLAIQKNPESALALIARAGFYLRQGDSAKAIADMNEAERYDLSDHDIRIRLAQEWIRAGHLEKAQFHVETLFKAVPQNQILWQTWADLAIQSKSQQTMQEVAQKGLDTLGNQSLDFMPMAAELFIQSGQLDRAFQCLEEMKKQNILPSLTAFLEGMVWQRRDDPAKAIKCWQEALSMGYNKIAKSPQLRLLLASAYSQQGDMQSALVQLQNACSEFPNSPACFMAMARHLARMGDWAGARQNAQTVARGLPDNLEARLIDFESQIQLLAAQGAEKTDPGWSEIDRQLADLETTAKGNNTPRFLRVQAALKKGDAEAAQRLLTGITPADPGETIRLALTSAEVSSAGGNIEEAIRILEGARGQFQDAIEPVRLLALLLLRKGDAARSEGLIKEALTRLKGPAAQRDLSLLLCATYEGSNRTDEAIAYLEDLAQRQPDAIWIRKRLLDYPKVLSNTDKAQKYVDQIKAQEGVTGGQWRYQQARVWFAMPDFSLHYASGVSLLKENLSTSFNDQASRKLLAAAYERAGETQLAMATYREALSQSPDDLSILIPMVSALYRAKEYDQADQILQRAAQRKLTHPALEGLQLESDLRQGKYGQASDTMEQMWNRDPNNPRIGLSLAILKLQQGQLDEAEKLLGQLREIDPNSLPLATTQVQLYLRQNRPQNAIQVCNDLVARCPDAAAVHLLYSRTLLATGQVEAAEKSFTQATVSEPRNPDVWVSRSSFYRNQGKLFEAMADMDRALAVEPNAAAIQKLAIALYLISQDELRVKQAWALLDKALHSKPEDVDLQIFKARKLIGEGMAPSIVEAEQILQRLTSNWPKNHEAWALLAEIAINQADAGKALDVALRGLSYNPNDRTLLMLKARAEGTRSPALAIQTLKGLLEIDPNDTNVLLALANAHMNSGEPDKAVALLRKPVSNGGPTDPLRCQTTLVVALYQKGDKTEAETLLAQLAQSSPNEPSILITQVRLLIMEQRWDDMMARVNEWTRKNPDDLATPTAIAMHLNSLTDPSAQRLGEQILRDLLTLKPDSLRILGVLSQILHKAGRVPETVEVYRKIVALDRQNVIAMNNLAWILGEEMGNSQEALIIANRGLEITPDYLDLLDTRGVTYYRLGRFDRALEDLNRCVRLYPPGIPGGVGSRFHLARTYSKLNRKEDAVKFLKEALDLQARTGGLSPQDLTEARQLLDELQR